jgi:hypothetical protein
MHHQSVTTPCYYRAPMPDRAALLSFAQTAAPYLTAQRIWLERLALIIPGPVATRWLLIADAVCLTAIGLASGRPRIWVPMALAVGFVGVNVAGMVLTDFYLGLAVFHLAAGSAAIVFARRWRWVGLTALCLTLALGILT